MASGPRPEGVPGSGRIWPPPCMCCRRDLDRLLAFLDTYERSDHPARIEALRWLQPVLDRHLRVLRRQRKLSALQKTIARRKTAARLKTASARKIG